MKKSENTIYKFLDFSLNPQNHTLCKSGSEINITSNAFQLLLYFVQNAKQTINRDTILNSIGANKYISDSTLYKQIQRLRHILGDNNNQKRIISTVHGVGFIFLPSVEINNEKENMEEIQQKQMGVFKILISILLTTTLVFLLFSHFSGNKHQLTLQQTIFQMQNAMSINKKAFVSQINIRSELGLLINKRLNIDSTLSWERRFFLYFDDFNQEEKFLFSQIRAYTEGPPYESNKKLLDLINQNLDVLTIIPMASELRNHLIIWLNKYHKIFKNSEKMCLLYVGVEDNAPYPSAVDEQVNIWLKKK